MSVAPIHRCRLASCRAYQEKSRQRALLVVRECRAGVVGLLGIADREGIGGAGKCKEVREDEEENSKGSGARGRAKGVA